MNQWMSRVLAQWVQVSFKHRYVIAVLTVIVFALSFVGIQKLFKIDPDLEALLPENTPTIEALKETQKRFGSTDMYTIAILLDDPAEIARVQDRLKEDLKKWEDVVTVQTDRKTEFFRDHALLYIPEKHLEKIKQKLVDKKDELALQGPLAVELDMDDEAEEAAAGIRKNVKDTSWFDASVPQQLGLPDEAAETFKKYFNKTQTPAKAGAQAAVVDTFDPKEGLADSLRSRLIGKTREGQWVGLVQAVLKYPSSNMDYVKTVLKRSKDLLAPYKSEYGSKLKIGVEGPYKEFEEVESLETNGLWATFISIGLNVLILVAFFRAAAPVLLIGGQAVFACFVTLVFAFLVYGRLNLYTVFVVSILFGLGIDYAVYVTGFAQRLVLKGKTWIEALSETYSKLFHSLLVACVTTAAGMATLLLSKFVGFYEFGVIGSVGIVISFIVTFLNLPAFIFILEDINKIKGLRWLSLNPPSDSGRSILRMVSGTAIAILSIVVVYALYIGLSPAIQREGMTLPEIIVSVLAFVFAVLVIIYTLRSVGAQAQKINWSALVRRSAYFTLAMTVVLAFFIPFQNFFEYDFSHLRDNAPKKKDNSLPTGVAMNSSRTSSQPIVILADNDTVLVKVHKILMDRLTIDKDPYLRSFLTLSSFVPPQEDQVKRLPYLAQIGEEAAASVFDKATGQDKEMIENLRLMAKGQVFGAQDIPSWSLDLLRERDKSYGKIGFIYGSYKSSDARDAAEFQKRYGPCEVDSSSGKIVKTGLCVEGANVKVYSSSFIYSDIVRFVKSDAQKMFAAMAVILLLTIALLLRNGPHIYIHLISMAVAVVWFLGLCGALHLKVGVFNLIAISTLQGVAVDVVTYLVLAYQRLGQERLRQLLSGISMLVVVCTMTTLSGYAGMLFTTHQGIVSIGAFAVIGLASMLITSLALTPWLCIKLIPKESIEYDPEDDL